MPTDLSPILLKVHALFQPYEKKKLKATGDGKTSYSLSSTRKIETLGREYDGTFFAGWRILKGAIGFCFNLIYSH